MSSKLDYLQKYMSKEDKADGKVKKRKKLKKRSNVAILDDDVDWREIAPKPGEISDEPDEDPDDAPAVAEFKDEAEQVRKKMKWKAVLGDRYSPTPSDLSPPRRQTRKRHDSPDQLDTISQSRGRSGQRQRHDSPHGYSHSPDSPPRRQRRRHDSPDLLPQRRRHDSPDLSPQRRRRHDSPDLSPQRRRRHDSPDLSPQRSSNPNQSSRHQSSPDLSPVRPGRRRQDSPNSDLSPVRRTSPDQDLSPRRRRDSKARPSRQDQRQRHASPKIIDRAATASQRGQQNPPPHRAANVPTIISDSSPPRRTNTSESKTLSGTKAGLQTSETLRKEVSEAQRERDRFFREMDPEVSGKQAETVYRKDGKQIDPKLERLRKRKEEMKKMEEDEQFMQWGRGMAQVKSAQEKLADDLYEMTKPLARSRDDEDLERLLKEREREGDPMLAFITKKKTRQTELSGKKERPTYRGKFPENRFGIRPGYRWDGIDRSNGFEKAIYARRAEKQSLKDTAYKWSVEDM